MTSPSPLLAAAAPLYRPLPPPPSRAAGLLAAFRSGRADLSGLLVLCSQAEALIEQIAAAIDQALPPPGPPPASSSRVLTVVNVSTVVSSTDLQAAVAAVQQQLAGDFAPAWGLVAPTLVIGPDTTSERIYVADSSTQAGVLGLHEDDASLVPVGYVFAQDSLAVGDWAATLSHEVLEQVADPWCSELAIGTLNGTLAGLALEVADPVENDEYTVAGRSLSNFVLPEWFNPGWQGQADQLGNLKAAGTLSPGGYVAWTIDLQNWQQTFGQKTPQAQRTAMPFSRRARRFRRATLKKAAAAPPKK